MMQGIALKSKVLGIIDELYGVVSERQRCRQLLKLGNKGTGRFVLSWRFNSWE